MNHFQKFFLILCALLTVNCSKVDNEVPKASKVQGVAAGLSACESVEGLMERFPLDEATPSHQLQTGRYLVTQTHFIIEKYSPSGERLFRVYATEEFETTGHPRLEIHCTEKTGEISQESRELQIVGITVMEMNSDSTEVNLSFREFNLIVNQNGYGFDNTSRPSAISGNSGFGHDSVGLEKIQHFLESEDTSGRFFEINENEWIGRFHRIDGGINLHLIVKYKYH